jgi:hypothetical protein
LEKAVLDKSFLHEALHAAVQAFFLQRSQKVDKFDFYKACILLSARAMSHSIICTYEKITLLTHLMPPSYDSWKRAEKKSPYRGMPPLKTKKIFGFFITALLIIFPILFFILWTL